MDIHGTPGVVMKVLPVSGVYTTVYLTEYKN
jgi:hypothetical protein